MNIKYDEIITKAAARKDALQELEQAAVHLSDVMDDEAVTYYQALQRYKLAYANLDQEAVNLLPDQAGHDLRVWVEDILGRQATFLVKGTYAKQTPQEALAALVS